MEFKVVGKEMLVKEVCKSGASGIVYLPKEWIGTRVAIIKEAE